MSGRAVLRLLCLAVAALAGPAHAAAVWPDFPIIQWQPRTPDQLAALKRIGVTAGAVIADRDHDGAGEAPLVATLRAAGMGYYVENIATDFYAQYHRYTPGKIASWRFADAQAAYRAHPDDPALLQRQPGLSDAVAQGRIDARLEATVRRHAADHPLFYDLGDETGIADLSAYWDFDTSPASLAGMRDWLQHEYPSLEALNAEWGTHYIRWDGVQPELTGAAMRRTDDNFAPWSDFKAWMDEAFARALRRGARAVHAADPAALAGIEGAQMPGWGGWDYTRLAHTVDVMEIYDSGENLAILRALNPHVIPLATAFGDTPEALHGLWQAVLNGARGLVLWDEDDTIVHANATPGLRAAAYRPLFAALHGTFGQAMRGAVPVTDPVAILYSPVSFRVQWMLDHRPLGDAWMHR
ncbi:MAG: beta-galactosidase, partial [Acetobacteraceae bacterium]|nr:beta-galactosidase [Acetobacteraceae bacterium]